MTPQQRADAYHAVFPKFPPLRADDRWLDGVWVLGNNYKGSGYYGAYPPGYLKRVYALFPDVMRSSVLHACSGSLQGVDGITVDLNPTLRPTICANVHTLPFRDAAFPLILADPPYSKADAVHYATPMVKRNVMMRELARVCRPGGHLVWLDTVLPMFSKTQWHWFGALALVRSTNHRVRLCSIFRRVDSAGA
jgi:SAM-dependent methyltransferase